MKLTYDTHSLRYDDKRFFLVSGEFHYFRVPQADWRRRMRLFKQAGGNAIATYVPWSIHEPTEGTILFGDRPERDLAAFLRMAQEEGLRVMLRPGPYQYSELVDCGLPHWLFEKYPSIRAKDPDGKDIGTWCSVSYMHPVVLEKARRYYAAFAEVARPFLAENGGPVQAIQLDNEIMGVHLWYGPADANPETFGYGTEDGRYPSFLRRLYGSIEAVNEAYGTSYDSFADARPLNRIPADAPAADERRRRDFLRCYLEQIRDFLLTLKGWVREDGLVSAVCHNCGSTFLAPMFGGMEPSMGSDYFLGFDQYYSLGPSFPNENPTVQYTLGTRFAIDMIHAMGYPALGLEVAGGSPSDVPPILRNDLLACYLSMVASGVKGLNFYIYTGGPNFGDTGASEDIYNYNAMILADGTPRETYESLCDLGRFLADHPKLVESEREWSVQFGFEWDAFRMGDWAPPGGVSGAAAQRAIEKGFLFALSGSKYPGKYVPLDALDPTRPLVLVSPSVLSERGQRAVVEFLEKGGRLLLAPEAPTLDENLRPCAILRDYLHLPSGKPARAIEPPVEAEGVRAFGILLRTAYDPATLPPEADAAHAFRQTRTGETFGWWQKAGAGEVCFFGTTFDYATFPQAVMLERILERMGARPVTASSNRNVLVETHVHPSGSRLVFVSNLHASPQSTTVTLFRDGKPFFERSVSLEPMQVLAIEV